MIGQEKNKAGQEKINRKPESINLISRKMLRRLLLASISIIVIIAIVIYTHHYIASKNANKATTASAYTATYKEIITSGKSGNNYQTLALGQNFLNNYGKTATKAQLYTVYSYIAIAYENVGNLGAAVNAQLNVISNTSDPSFYNYYIAGQIYDSLKNKSMAIKYYQLALDKAKNNKAIAFESDGQTVNAKNRLNQLESSK